VRVAVGTTVPVVVFMMMFVVVAAGVFHE